MLITSGAHIPNLTYGGGELMVYFLKCYLVVFIVKCLYLILLGNLWSISKIMFDTLYCKMYIPVGRGNL